MTNLSILARIPIMFLRARNKIAISVVGCLVGMCDAAQGSPNAGSPPEPFRYEVLTKQDDVIWGFDFVDARRVIFTQRNGRIKILDLASKRVAEITGAPEVYENGQGGLLDIRVDPSDSSVLFLTYSKPITGNGGTTALARAKLQGNTLTNLKDLLVTDQPSTQGVHFGSRIEFDGAGHVFFTVGDRNDRPKVQDLRYHNGKIMRLKKDGTIPKDNPFVNQESAQPEIWATGLRSPQGLAMHPVTGVLWESEMGPKGGDEINIIEPRKNYGWPEVTYGREYHGTRIGFTEKVGTQQPIAHWTPSISPSGMTIYNGHMFPKWKGHFFLGTLSGMHLRRLEIENNKVIAQEELLGSLGLRIRNVRGGPDGALYLSTDNGLISRLVK